LDCDQLVAKYNWKNTKKYTVLTRCFSWKTLWSDILWIYYFLWNM